MSPRISVVIPTYNRAALVTQAVESALAQTRPPHQIVVIDDGSTDSTPEAMARFGNKILYIQQKNQRVAAARNNGIRHATGDWVAFLDSDECWHRQKLEVQAGYIEKHPEVDVVAAHIKPMTNAEDAIQPLPAGE